MTRKADIITSNQGFAVAFYGNSRRGREWLVDNCDWPVEGFAEHRFAADIIMGAVADGLRVQDSDSGRFARAA